MRGFTSAMAGILVFVLSAGQSPAPPPPPKGSTTDSVSTPVPAKAALVVTVNGWGKAKGRFEATMKAAVPDQLKTIMEGFDQLLQSEWLEGRDLKGLDMDKRMYEVVERWTTDTEPPVTAFFPTPDAKAFYEGFFKADEKKAAVKKANGVTQVTLGDEDFYTVAKDGWTILSNNAEAIAKYLAPYETLSAKETGAEIAEAMATADIALYLNTEIINETFGDQIKQFRGLIDILGKGGLGGGGFGPGMDKDQIEAGITFLKGLFQFVEDSRAVGLSFEFKPHGIGVRLQSRFAADSLFGKILATEKPTPMRELAKFPSSFAMLSGQAVGPRTGAGIRSMVKEFSVPEGNEEAAKAIAAFQEILNRDETLSILTASNFPSQSITITQAKDANAYVEAYTKMLESLPEAAKAANVIIKGKPAVTRKAQTSGSFTFHKIVTTLDYEATVKDQPDGQKETAIATMKALSKEKSTTWFGTDGKVVVALMEDDWAAAEKTLKAYLAGSAGDVAIAVRKELPENVSYLTLMDGVYAANYLADMVGQFGDAIPNLPIQLPKLEKLKADPVHLGFSIVLKPEHGQADLFIPAKTIGHFHKVFGKLLEDK